MGLWPSDSRFKRRVLIALVSGGIAFWLYLRALAPGLLSYDFAEFQYLPAKLGLPHPNGFPFYMLLGWLWSKLPFGNLAFRMNLISAFFGGAATAAFALLLEKLIKQEWIALAGSFFLAFLPAFHFYSAGAERYTLLMFLLLASFLSALCWDRGGQVKHLALSSFLMGLALATHPAAFLALPFWLLYCAFSRPRCFLQALLPAIGALFLPLTLYLYIPWRWIALAQHPAIPGIGISEAVARGLAFVWYTPNFSPKVLWEYVAGLRGFGLGMIKGGWKEAISSLGSTRELWLGQFPLPLWPLALVGSIWLLWANHKLWLSLAGFAGLDLLLTVYIKQGKPEAYLLPAFAVFALWLALGLAVFIRKWKEFRLPEWASWGLAALLLWGLYQRDVSSLNISRFSGVESWWREVIHYPIEEGSALIAHWGDLTPLWYLQQAEGLRPDLLGLFPPESGIASKWLAQGRALYQAGPTHGFDPDFPSKFKVVPWGKLLRIFPPEANFSCPAGLLPASENPEWPLSVRGWAVQESHILLELCWEARSDFPANLYLSVRLLSPSGMILYQKDEPLLPQWYPYPDVKAGEKGLFITSLSPPTELPPISYRVELALFTVKREGWEQIGFPHYLGEVRLARSKGRAKTLPFASQAGPFRVVDFEASKEVVRPGDPVRLEVVWEAISPPMADYFVAFKLVDAKGTVKVTEPQPLFPGYPTAWWGRGERVRGIYIFQAPRHISGRAFWIKPIILSPWGEENWKWLPFYAGPFFVQDRPHLWKLPEGVTRVSCKFGELAELVGYTLVEGEELKLTLYWKVLSETEDSYHVFVHLIDERGHIIAQHDGIPSGGAVPTNIWIEGELIEDVHFLPVDIPPGKYAILVGLYNPHTMERLKAGVPGDAFPLKVLELKRTKH